MPYTPCHFCTCWSYKLHSKSMELDVPILFINYEFHYLKSTILKTTCVVLQGERNLCTRCKYLQNIQHLRKILHANQIYVSHCSTTLSHKFLTQILNWLHVISVDSPTSPISKHIFFRDVLREIQEPFEIIYLYIFEEIEVWNCVRPNPPSLRVLVQVWICDQSQSWITCGVTPSQPPQGQ